MTDLACLGEDCERTLERCARIVIMSSNGGRLFRGCLEDKDVEQNGDNEGLTCEILEESLKVT